MKRLELKHKRLSRRRARIRGRVTGNADRPRISIFKSNRYVYVQVIDDSVGKTLTSVSNAFGEYKALKSTVADAAKLGEVLGKKMVEMNLKRAVFDRNGNLYHGVIKAVADGARKAGVEF